MAFASIATQGPTRKAARLRAAAALVSALFLARQALLVSRSRSNRSARSAAWQDLQRLCRPLFFFELRAKSLLWRARLHPAQSRIPGVSTDEPLRNPGKTCRVRLLRFRSSARTRSGWRSRQRFLAARDFSGFAARLALASLALHALHLEHLCPSGLLEKEASGLLMPQLVHGLSLSFAIAITR